MVFFFISESDFYSFRKFQFNRPPIALISPISSI